MFSNYVVDTNQPYYKLNSHEGVITDAEKIKRSFSLPEIRKVVELYEIFGRKILAEQQVDHSSQLIQSLFFHNATFTTVERSLKQNTDCGCTPQPLYFGGKISFWCQEDYLIDPNLFIKAIDDSKYTMNTTEKRLYNYLQNNRSKAGVSVDQLLNIMEPKASFMQRVGNAYYSSTKKVLKNNPPTTSVEECIKGSDLGCCSNYAGCCWYYDIICLYHDAYCLKCDHWYCGPLCKPET